MSADLAIPFVMATAFTGGAILIKHLDRHAERVTEILALTVATCFALFICGLTIAYTDAIAAGGEGKVNSRYRAEVNKVNPRPAKNPAFQQSATIPLR